MSSARFPLGALVTEPPTFILSFIASHLPPWVAAKIPTILGVDIRDWVDIAHTHNYQPHRLAPFEGYYTRLITSNGATILLIFSTVREARSEHKPNLLHFSYIPSAINGNSRAQIISVYPTNLEFKGKWAPHENEITLTATDDHWNELGRYWVNSDGEGIFELKLPVEDGTIDVNVKVRSRKPWEGLAIDEDCPRDGNGPEGQFAALKCLLPLHWFVWSVHSTADLSIRKLTSGNDDPEILYEGEAKAHVEKNWGRSFPTGWVWIQSIVPTTLLQDSDVKEDEDLKTPPYIAFAGGQTLVIKAFLFGFSCPPLHGGSSNAPITWSFRPLYTMLFPLPFTGRFFSPFCKEEYNSLEGLYKFEVIDWTWKFGWRKVKLLCKGPPATSSSCDSTTTTSDYVRLPCPMSDGHDNEFAKETFDAIILVEAFQWKRTSVWDIFSITKFCNPTQWQKVASQEFKRTALEWGGNYWGGRTVEISWPKWLRKRGESGDSKKKS
ncbi:hypothetical protein DFH27DRAFT_177866 [Peziza echinospora]|nr:hypothetical protein DFH27DRAFT_177866 [Peziza echinospora]